MSFEYIVLQSNPQDGPFNQVVYEKLDRGLPLQEALNKLGEMGYELCTTIYGPTGSRHVGDHYCEGFILKRPKP